MARGDARDRSPADWDGLAADYDRIRERIERWCPASSDYNERVRLPGGFELPKPSRDRVFATASGKARFTVHPLPKLALEPGQFLMMTIRSHDQYNTTIYGLERPLSRGAQRPARDLPQRRRLPRGAFRQGRTGRYHQPLPGRVAHGARIRRLPYPIPRRCAATYFPEANVLVPLDHTADKSNTPASKSVVITLRRL